jgi:signal transduction histidine kinase
MNELRPIREGLMAWRAPSLRGRIALLAGTVVLLLIVTLCVLVWVLRTTQANVVERSEKHLQAVAQSMANAYETRPNRSISLATVEVGPPPPRPDASLTPGPPPPPVAPPSNPGPLNPGAHHARAQEQVLEALTANVLQDETGIEGGFFRPGDQRLVGYAFPTHEGPGDPTALPARETPNIVNVASAAASQGRIEKDQFYGTHDVVLFMAIPVCDSKGCSGGPVGSAWLMQRLPGAESDRKRALLWSAFGFGTVACITVLLAFLVLRQVGEGTEAVLDRLTWMESDLARKEHPGKVRLAEFHRVLDGLDRLGETLRMQIERERDLQSRVRQNERLAAIGQLAAGVAHELRNPLATIRLRAQMAQRKTQEETTAQASAVILAEVDRLDAIIERLLDFSRPIRLNRTHVDLTTLAQSAVQRWAARHPGIRIRYIGEDGVSVLADAMRFEQVLDNLLENAANQLVETKPSDPLIEVACSRADGAISLAVADNGGGFTPTAIQSAMEPFFTTRAKGTGLGLAITQEIVHAFGGTIVLSNHAGGALVRIQIPESEAG